MPEINVPKIGRTDPAIREKGLNPKGPIPFPREGRKLPHEEEKPPTRG